MRRVALSAASLLLAVSSLSCGNEGGAESAEFGRRALDIVRAMDDGDFKEVREALHLRLKSNLTEERLAEAWGDFVDEHGELTGAPALFQISENGTLVTVELKMTKRDAQAQVRFLPSGEVVGLDFGDVGDPGT